jgi:hypothetical protein
MAEEKGDAKKVVVSHYRLNLVPGEEQRRSQWNMIFISDIPVTVDFHHTDMLEKVVVIKKAEITPKNDEVIIG